MNRTTTTKISRSVAALVAATFVVAACGGDDDDDAAGTTPAGTEAGIDTTTGGSDTTTAGSDTTTGGSDAGAAVDLSACPNPLVIQTDWFPEAEHGGLYQMVGEGYSVDTGTNIIRRSSVGTVVRATCISSAGP